MRILNFPSQKIKGDITHEKLIDVFEKEKDNTIWRKEAINAFFDAPEKFRTMEKEGQINFMDYNINRLIDAFTEVPLNEELYNLHKKMIDGLNNGYIVDIKLKENGLLVQTTHGPIKAMRLTDAMKGIAEELPLKDVKKRRNQCHYLSLKLSQLLNNNHYVATSYVQDFSKKTRYLHTWIEVPRVGKPALILDPANNLVMNKWNYYLLYHITGAVHKISKKEFAKDTKMVDYLINHDEWYSKLYLSNRPLAIKEYKRLKIEEGASDGRSEDAAYEV